MPRRGSRGRRRTTRRGSRGLNPIVRHHSRLLMNITTASTGLADFTLTPALDARLNVMAQTFQSCRFTKFILTCFPGSGVISGATEYDWAAGFSPQDTDAIGSGSTTSSVMEMPYAMYISVNTTTNHRMTVTGLVRHNAYKWFDTNSAGPTLVYNQGQFLFEYANTAVVNLRAQLEFWIEFTNPIPSNVTLSRLARLPGMRDAFEALDRETHVSDAVALGMPSQETIPRSLSSGLTTWRAKPRPYLQRSLVTEV